VEEAPVVVEAGSDGDLPVGDGGRGGVVGVVDLCVCVCVCVCVVRVS
jgi:hypothetical protein